MQKSFIDRIFPQSSVPLLPQHEQSVPLTTRSSKSPTSPPRMRTHENVFSKTSTPVSQSQSFHSSSNASTSPRSKFESLQSAPLSASVLHHDDPFLPLERAARALQDAIQSLLDTQSYALSGRLHGIEQDDVASCGSLTPTQSIVAPKSPLGMRVVPVRQPVKKAISLRGARRGLARKMREFAELRKEELQILNSQTGARTNALERVRDLEARKEGCVAEIESIRQEDTSATVSNLRAEAKNVQIEIEELEHKLLELRVRHRHLSNQADQLESTLESKISSFRGTMAMVDREARELLRRPPISHALVDVSATKQSGIHALKPERRTLEMAKEQWTVEQEILAQRKNDVEDEYTALVEGERIWSRVSQQIDHFERKLRARIAQLGSDEGENIQTSMDSVLNELGKVMESLESDLALAESKNWSLLICAVGAELEAFRQARELLEQTQQAANGPPGQVSNGEPTNTDAQIFGDETGKTQLSPNGSVASNQSLKDTLDEFSTQPNIPTEKSSNMIKYESEDDEPPADFLLSR